LSSPSPTLLRPEKDGAATGVGALCTYHPDPSGPGLNKEQLYRELSQLTHDITQLGPYTLDQDSLYVNGEKLPSFIAAQQDPYPPSLFLSFLLLLFLSLPAQVIPTRLWPPLAVSTLRFQKSL
jgi:hypothetical protein